MSRVPAPVSRKGFSVVEGKYKIFPIEMSALATVDFGKEENSNAIISSGELLSCPFLVIKNFNPETGDYKNSIVTACHFFPNNAYDEEVAIKNINKAIADFEANGGTMKQASVQVFGGGLGPMDRHKRDTARGVLEDAIAGMMLEERTEKPVKFHKASFGTSSKESSVVLVSGGGTEVHKEHHEMGVRTDEILTPKLEIFQDENHASRGALQEKLRSFKLLYTGKAAEEYKSFESLLLVLAMRKGLDLSLMAGRHKESPSASFDASSLERLDDGRASGVGRGSGSGSGSGMGK